MCSVGERGHGREVLASHRPRHPVGWLLAFALLVVASGVTGRYAKYGLLVRPQSLPAAIYAVAYSSIALPPIAECLSFRSSADADRVAAHAALAVVGLGHGGRSTAGGGVRSPGAVRAALPVGRQPAGGARPGGSATSSAPFSSTVAVWPSFATAASSPAGPGHGRRGAGRGSDGAWIGQGHPVRLPALSGLERRRLALLLLRRATSGCGRCLAARPAERQSAGPAVGRRDRDRPRWPGDLTLCLCDGHSSGSGDAVRWAIHLSEVEPWHWG